MQVSLEVHVAHGVDLRNKYPFLHSPAGHTLCSSHPDGSDDTHFLELSVSEVVTQKGVEVESTYSVHDQMSEAGHSANFMTSGLYSS